MKTFDKISILCMGLMLLACAGSKEPVPETPEDVKPEPETRTLTFVLPEDGEKTAWVAGDQIVVHGEYAKDQVVVTLKSGDILADGKTAKLTVDGLYPYVNEECTSTLYAAYPADAVDNLAHCFYYTKFNATDRQIMAAYNDATDKFQFQNLCGSMSFKTGEDFTALSLVGNKKETIGLEFLQVLLTDKEQNYAQYLGTPIVQMESKASAETTIYFPAGTTFRAGLYIKFKDASGKFVKCYRTYEPISIERAKNTDLGDISADIQVYDDPFSGDILDLDTDGNANCYILTDPGKFKFKAVHGNDHTFYFEDAAKADVLWETWNDDSEVEVGSVISSASYAEDYVIIHTPATLHPGNAVVALRDVENNILWSWHIWVPKTAIETKEYDNLMGAPSMDRHLGALVATESGKAADQQSYGLFYQWGRKDPFPGMFANSPITVAGVQMERQDGPITIAESLAKPTLYTYHLNGSEGYEWCSENTSDFWGDIWGNDSDKTIYDPCPAGYRVPKSSGTAWTKSDTGWNYDLTNGIFEQSGLVFPYCGYMDDNKGGYAKNLERSVIWCAAASSATNGKAMYIKGAKYDGTSARAARGASVRCVTE